jgi:hypothetical protein
MPWVEHGRGYTKATKKGQPQKKGGFVGNPKQYEKLKSLGWSKEKAAAITNARTFGKSVEVTSAFGIVHKSMPIGLSGLPASYATTGAQAVRSAPRLARAAHAHVRAGKAGRLRKIEEAGRRSAAEARAQGITKQPAESFARPTFGRKKQAVFDRAFRG